MTNHSKMYLLISNIRHQLAPGVHTYGKCASCDGVARGSGVCAECVTKELGQLVGRTNADEFLWATQQVNRTIDNMETCINEQQDEPL